MKKFTRIQIHGYGDISITISEMAIYLDIVTSKHTSNESFKLPSNKNEAIHIMGQISRSITKHGFLQEHAGQVIGVTQERVSQVIALCNN
ncbi:hypothetical protein [Cetobacterium somerae]